MEGVIAARYEYHPVVDWEYGFFLGVSCSDWAEVLVGVCLFCPDVVGGLWWGIYSVSDVLDTEVGYFDLVEECFEWQACSGIGEACGYSFL